MFLLHTAFNSEMFESLIRLNTSFRKLRHRQIKINFIFYSETYTIGNNIYLNENREQIVNNLYNVQVEQLALEQISNT